VKKNHEHRLAVTKTSAVASPSTLAVADYTKTMAEDLSTATRAAGLPTLTYLLDIVALEAAGIVSAGAKIDAAKDGVRVAVAARDVGRVAVPRIAAEFASHAPD
jgi:hypothetical protein